MAETEATCRALCCALKLCKYTGDKCNTSRCAITPETAGKLRAVFKPTWSDNDLRTLWRDVGGSFHGPHVEMAYIEEVKLLPLLRRLLTKTD